MSKWVVCGSGPSLSGTDFSLLRSFRSWNVLAINCAWQWVPWARAMYAGDLPWWTQYGYKAQAFAGEKWTRDKLAAARYGLRRVLWVERDGLSGVPHCITRGGNSGYQGVHLVYTEYQATRIVLLGFDMHLRNGTHCHGDHPAGMLNAPAHHVPVWRQKFRALADDLKAEGVPLVNATPGTALTCMPCMPLRDALRC